MHNQATTPWIKKGMLLLLIVGTLLRLVYAARPFDQRIMTSWRQADYVQIARNYDREGMNILYPRIDWRGNSPGYVEAEFPLVPWLGAAMYRIFGYHENLLRVAPCVFSILTLFLFGWLARKELPQEGALAATAFFALNPLLFYLSTAIQPESLMLFMVVLGYACIRLWEAQPALRHLLPASLVAGGAILAKTPAASLGLLLGYAVLKKLGWRTFTQPGIYLAALAGLLPPLAWYAWAHSFWLEYGNSLGISNESHFIGLDILFPPTFLAGNLKWETLSRNQDVLNNSISRADGLYNADCSLAPVLVFLNDHKAETLQRAVKAVEGFAKEHNKEGLEFMLAAGNAGIEAATNEVIAQSELTILILVYICVAVMCLITFRSIAATICIVLPLILTSVLGNALMAFLGIGVKVATLPVVALGVGIGVDYGIYIYSRLESFLRAGLPLQEAYYQTLKSTGKAVLFTGLCLAIGVATWMFSAIKFQADMGLMLTFMFIVNMFGALWLLPALARFLIRPEKLAGKTGGSLLAH